MQSLRRAGCRTYDRRPGTGWWTAFRSDLAATMARQTPTSTALADGTALDGLPHSQLWSSEADGGPPLSFAVVDLETTGASAIYDRIIEVAVVRLEGGEIVDRYEQLVDPKVAIPPFITRLTGIDGRMLKGKPAFGEIAGDVRQRPRPATHPNIGAACSETGGGSVKL